MPRITPDLAHTDANTPVYDKGLYQVKIVEHKPRMYYNNDDELRIAMDYDLEMVGSVDDKGKVNKNGLEGRSVRRQTLWLHTPKTAQMNKQFLMAACGFDPQDPNAEEEANKKLFAKFEDWVDGEPGDDESVSCGDLWAQPEGRLVNVYMDTDVYNDREQQQFKGWYPVK